MAINEQQVAFARDEKTAARRQAVNIAANDRLRVRAELQTQGANRRLTAAELLLAYDPALDARSLKRTS